MSTLQALVALGQSPWLDFITRDLLRSGRLARMVRAGDVTGLTSNPTIFEQAITRGTDYDDALEALVRAGKPAGAIVDALMIEDIRAAADVFRPLYERTKRADGYVSIEVDPSLADDAAATLREARRVWRAVNRPNLLVKIPATLAGVTAVEETIAAGINVNVTLIFSLARYEQVMDAYLHGLTRRLEAGTRVDRIASVASFFVSRVDTAVDRLLDARPGSGTQAARGGFERLRGKAAIANAKLAYAAFRERFAADRFGLLAREGARPQRPLWASTSTKDPAYPDVYYVEALIGPDTVNTLPPATLAAYLDHGHPEVRLDAALDRARDVLAQLRQAGIDLDEVTHRLEVDGVAAFLGSHRSLLAAVRARRDAVVVSQRTAEQPGAIARGIDGACRTLDTADVGPRLWRKDATLWAPAESVRAREVAGRLGWLDPTRGMAARVAGLAGFADEVRAAGFTHALLCGFGHAVLAPEMFRRALGSRRDALDLAVLDSTDPAAVLAAERRSDPARTLYLIASKADDGPEIHALLAFLWDRTTHLLGERAAQHFVAITDHGTRLEELARTRGFRRVFLEAADVDPRYAALSAVALVPAALMGHDVEKLLARTERMLAACGPTVRAAKNPALRLAAVLAAAARAGRDKLTFLTPDKVSPFAEWAARLVAEATGGALVPVAGEPQATPPAYGKDRLFVALQVGSARAPLAAMARAGHPGVSIRLNDVHDLAGECLRWEIAACVAGHLLGFDPFERTDGEAAATGTMGALADPARRSAPGESIPVDAPDFSARLWQGLAPARGAAHVAFSAFVAASPARTALLAEARVRLRRRLGIATTAGYGRYALPVPSRPSRPGSARMVVVQLVADDPVDLPVPGAGYSFGALKAAQAAADHEALTGGGTPVVRVHLGRNVDRGLAAVVAALAHPPAQRARRPTGTLRAQAGRRR